MNEEFKYEAYLYISPNQFGIYIFDLKHLKNIYKQELKFENNSFQINLTNLDKFLEDNIFKIEKLIGKFIENIFLVIECNETKKMLISVKKKNDKERVNKKILESALIDAKDLFKENYHNNNIMHIIIKKYLVNGIDYSSYKEDLLSEYLCLEIEFRYFSNSFKFEIEKILQKFQIKIICYMDGDYVKNFKSLENTELSEKAHKLYNGLNCNEVIVVPKNQEKKGFFERFFQLFG